MLALSPPSALLARYRTWSASRRVVLSAGRTDLSFLGENSLHQIHVANLSYRCVAGECQRMKRINGLKYKVGVLPLLLMA